MLVVEPATDTGAGQQNHQHDDGGEEFVGLAGLDGGAAGGSGFGSGFLAGVALEEILQDDGGSFGVNFALGIATLALAETFFGLDGGEGFVLETDFGIRNGGLELARKVA